MSLRSQSPVAAEVFASPNHGERRGGCRPDMIILHYTGMPDAEGALRWLCNPDSQVSAHYFVFEDGRTLQLVGEERRAWHAGAGSWAGDTDINSRSIGIEIANAGHDGGLPPYPAGQIGVVMALVADLAPRWSILPERILAHSDVAPARKQDPGELFPWDRLYEGGIGHWVRPRPLGEGLALTGGAAGPDVEALQAQLAAYGYGLDVTGVYDQTTEQVVTAFQRHFRPERVDGIADASTCATLRDLLCALPERG